MSIRKEQALPFDSDQHLIGWHQRSIQLMNYYAENPARLSRIARNMLEEVNRIIPLVSGPQKNRAIFTLTSWSILEENIR